MTKLEKRNLTSQWVNMKDIISEIKADWGNTFRFTENTIVIHNGTPDLAQSIQNIFKAISTRLKPQRKSIDHLYITYYSWHSDEDHLKALFSSIARYLPDIRGLTMSFVAGAGLTNSKDFAYNLCKILSHLERLELNFYNLNKQTDQDLKDISSKICKNMQNLKRLVLGFSGNKAITSKSVKTVIANINNYQHKLTGLSLSFIESFIPFLLIIPERCELINDEAFGWNLSNLSKKLQRIALNFSLCQDITEDGLYALGSSISRTTWPNLQQLILQFYYCYLISKEGPEVFVSMMTENLRLLRFLKLNFSWIVKLNDKTLDSICNSIKENLSNLKELCLDLSCCSRLTQKTRKGLHERLNFVPSLTLIL